MFLKYSPDDANEQNWEFKLGKLRVMETEAIERKTGYAYGSEFKQRLLIGDVRARRALLWTMLRRSHGALKFEDVDFADDELIVEFDKQEWQDVYDAVASAPGIDESERAAQLALYSAAMAEAPEGSGKARAASSSSGTGSPSANSSNADPATSTT